MKIFDPHIPGIVDGFRDDVFTAMNERGEEYDVKCPVCLDVPGERGKCSHCAGRGFVDHVPYCEDPWNEVIDNLFVGGHQCQPGNGEGLGKIDVIVRDEFDLVVSLYDGGSWYGPSHGRSIRHTMDDADLDPDHHTRLDELAEEIFQALANGEKVLVRCWAGLNRSSLVAALALIKMGWNSEDAISDIRQARGPYALFNESFTDYLRSRA